MTQARIEIRTRNVDHTEPLGKMNDRFGPKTKGPPQHLFVIHIDSNGQETLIRGGPATNNMFTDDIAIIKSPYGKDVNGGKPSIDYVPNAPRVIIAQGSDAEIQFLVDRMWAKAQEINQGGYDYKINDQNCNTAVRVLVDHIRIPVKLPLHHDGSNIWVPGIQINEFSHTSVDQFIKESGNEFKAAMENYREYLKSINILQGKNPNPQESPTSAEEAFETASTRIPNANSDSTHDAPLPHPKEFSWTDSSTWTQSDPESSGYKPWTYDFWDKPQTTLFEKQQDLFQNYKPDFPNEPLFIFKHPFSENNLINEPLSLYGKQDPTSPLYQTSLKELNAIHDLRNSVRSSLNDPTNFASAKDLISQASSTYTQNPSFFSQPEPEILIASNTPNSANPETTNYFFLQESLLSNLQQSAQLNSWTYPIRTELAYAASHVSPLVFDMDGDGIKLLPYTKGTYFDIDNDGFKEKVGWHSPGDGQLARDINQNGKIDDITELFGDDLISAFFKLSLIDSNDDKIIDSQDESFNELLIWQDKNSNGFSEPNELQTLTALGIKDISLNTKPDDRVIEGNKITSTSTFTYTDGRSGEIADVHYHNDDMDSWYKGKSTTTKKSKDLHTEDAKRFRQQLLEELCERINNPDTVDKNSDWLADLIKLKANDYIEHYKSKKEGEIERIINKGENLNSRKKSESKEKCAAEDENLQREAEQKLEALEAEARNELFEELQKNLDQEKENIASRHNQKYTSAHEALLKDINSRLNQANTATQRTAFHKKWTQQVFNKATAANKAKFNQEYRDQHTVLKERYGTTITEETEKIIQDYQNEYIQKANQLAELLENKETNKFFENQHERFHACEMEEKGIQSLLIDQCSILSQAVNKSIDDFTNTIKQEANNVYTFFINKVIPQILSKETKSEGNSDSNPNSPEYSDSPKNNNIQKLPKASDWLNDTFFTSQQNNDTKHGEDSSRIKIDPDTLFMPLMRGHGQIPSLHIAMTSNPTLKDLVLNFMVLKPSEFGNIYNNIVNILYEWAGVSQIPEDARATAGGANIEARKVAFVEQVTGQEFKQLGAAKFVGQHASTAVQKAWDIALMRATKHLLIQGPFTPLFPKAEYSFVHDNTNLNGTLNEILNISKNFAGQHKLGYDFWVQLGYILALSATELNSTINEIKSKLSALAGEPVMLDITTFGLIGDNKNNIIKGTSGSDYIKGLGGHDKLYGKNGSDHIEGDSGNDEIYGDQGIDRLYGGDGNDKIFGGEDRDFIYGGNGNDKIYGQEGDDHIEGGPGADIMDGGEGINTLSYGNSSQGVSVSLLHKEDSHPKQTGDASGDQFKNFQNLGGSEFNDNLKGDNQDNYINGEGGDDIIEGLAGDDHLFGATGKDTLYGGPGDDHLSGFEGPDLMDGGEGSDTANYNHPYATHGVKVDLENGVGYGGHAHNDTYKDIENAIGSKHKDLIQGNNETNLLQGMGGDDIIQGRDGDDIIAGGEGADNLFGEEGDDTIHLTGDGDYANGGDGIDTVSYRTASKPVILNMLSATASTTIINEDKFEEFENAQGSEFDDDITGDDKDNILSGLDGNDFIKGGKGDDTIIGGLGDNVLHGEEGDDRIMGDEGQDEIDGGEGLDIVDYSNEPTEGIKINLETGTTSGGIAQGDTFENIEGVVGTKFDDLLIGDQNNNFLFGRDGNDELKGGDGDDQLSGGSGNNTLNGGSGVDLASYTGSNESININLAEGKSSKEGVYEDTYIDIEGIIGSPYNDTIIGDNNDNYLYGGEGDDYIKSGGGHDNTLSGGKGNNILEGGNGRDEFLLTEGSNTVDGGEGEDTVNYAAYKEKDHTDNHTQEFIMRSRNNLLPNSPAQTFTTPTVPSIPGLEINLMTATVQKPGELLDRLTNIENVIGTNFDDIITGDDKNNHLFGTNGNDKIYGGKGDDTIVSGWGASDLYGEEGNDLFIIKGFPANINGGEGIDLADFMNLPIPIEGNLKEAYLLYKDASNSTKSKLEDIEGIRGTKFNDVLYDNDGDNIIAAGNGDDIIYLTNGNDSVHGQEGKDTFYLAGAGNKQIWGGGIDSDTFIITKDFQSHNKTSTVIVDFDSDIRGDKIDLTAFKHLKTIEDLNLEQITHDNQMFAVLPIDQSKWISLYNVDIGKLHPSNFIFANEEYIETCSQFDFNEIFKPAQEVEYY